MTRSRSCLILRATGALGPLAIQASRDAGYKDRSFSSNPHFGMFRPEGAVTLKEVVTNGKWANQQYGTSILCTNTFHV
jgi:hypothetical protein